MSPDGHTRGRLHRGHSLLPGVTALLLIMMGAHSGDNENNSPGISQKFQHFVVFSFFFLMFVYFERERERERASERDVHASRGEAERERERENPKQALLCQHRVQPGPIPRTARS